MGATTRSAMEAEVRKTARELVQLEQQTRAAIGAGNLQHAADLWTRREVVRQQRSYLMRMLWTQQEGVQSV